MFLGKYRIERRIGEGGMGAVYAALDEDLARRVAIKVLLPRIAKSPVAVGRFINEGRAAARIEGEHVARVYGAGRTSDDVAYMILEYLDGADLAALIKQRGPMQASDAVDFMLEALEAVAEAHHHGIVHRDLKPGNLFLARRSNGTFVVKVLDFGISKTTNLSAELGPEHQGLTATQATLGSPNYMSPDQLRSTRDVDRRSDIWSLGVILYEMLTGTVPFHGQSLGELFAAILEAPPTPIARYRPDLPTELQAVIHGCLERDPNRRIRDAYQLAQGLAPFAKRSRGSIERIRTFSDVAEPAPPTPAQLLQAPPPPRYEHAAPPLPAQPTAGSGSLATPAATMHAQGSPAWRTQSSNGWTDARTGSSTGSTTQSSSRPFHVALVAIPVSLVVLGGLVAVLFLVRSTEESKPAPAVSAAVSQQPPAMEISAPPASAPPPSSAAPSPSAPEPVSSGPERSANALSVIQDAGTKSGSGHHHGGGTKGSGSSGYDPTKDGRH